MTRLLTIAAFVEARPGQYVTDGLSPLREDQIVRGFMGERLQSPRMDVLALMLGLYAERVARKPLEERVRELEEALGDIATMLPGSVPLPMTEEQYLRAMLHECVRKARAALAQPAPAEEVPDVLSWKRKPLFLDAEEGKT